MNSFTMLGVGHSEAVQHWNTNALIESNGKRLLIDAGYTIKFALADQGLSLADIDAIFITHVHADHAFGLERLGYECRFRYQTRPKLFLMPDLYDELWERTLKGVMGQVGEGPASLEDFFEVRFIEQRRFAFEAIRLEVFANRHTPQKPSYGVMINDQLLYSGDTRPIPDVIEQYQPTLIFHDCTLSDWNPVHASVRELRETYPSWARERMRLMSYEDDWARHQGDIERDFMGFARQGERIDLDAL
ncbi:MBL fold metallo-hydrolase [Marinobacteraceae bacterium S3BR75-40.1]